MKKTGGFFADWGTLPRDEYLKFVYHLVPDGDPTQAATHLCAESSTAMWHRVGVDEDLRELHGARVVAMEPLPDRPGAYRLEIAYPHRNFGPRIPNLLTAAAGEGAFYCPGVITIKLVDIEFPEEFLRNFAGPQFGLNGLRAILGVHDRPLFVGVVKPNVGLSPTAFAELAGEAWEGGLDICKDDEMQADTVWSPLGERVGQVSNAKRRAEGKTGEKKLFIANVTDEVSVMPSLVRQVQGSGADIVMCNPILTGLSAVRAIRDVAHVPIMGHFAGIAALSRDPDFGISSVLLTKLMRLAGCDVIGIAGFGTRMKTSIREVKGCIAACLSPMGAIKQALPIPGGGDWAGTLQTVYDSIGHNDFGFIAGRGVFGHPMGPRAGAVSIRQAWDAVARGQSIDDAARTHPELAAAVKAFSGA